METLKKRYRDLETQTLATLRDLVINSKVESKVVSHSNALHVGFESFSELVIVHDQLTLIGFDQQHYSIFDLSLEDLITIVENNS